MKTVRLPVSPDTAALINICVAGRGLEVAPSFTDRVIDMLQARYPNLSDGILADCVYTTRRECVRVAVAAGANKLAEYETSDTPTPTVASTTLIAGLEVMVKAIMEAK